MSSNSASAGGHAGPARRAWLADLPTAVKISLLIGLAVVTTVAVGLVGQQGISNADTTAHRVGDQIADPAIALGHVRESFVRMRFKVFQAAVDADQSTIDDSLKAYQGLRDQTLSGLRSYGSGPLDGGQRQQFDGQLMPAVNGLVTVLEKELIPLADHPSTAVEKDRFASVFLKDGQPLVDRAQAAFDTLAKIDEQRMNDGAAQISAVRSRSTWMLWLFAAIGGLLLAGLGAAVVRVIRRALVSVQDALAAMAQGDLTRDPHVTSHDELGQMAASLASAQEALRATVRTITSSSHSLASSAEQLSGIASEVASSAMESSTQSNQAAAAAEQVSHNVQTVAAATEQMSASIHEISQSSSDAVRVAASAVGEAERANATVAKLGDSSAEIGSVVKVITGIAEQTNLLALNATIEAARAGEAGKGFAVVAQEVKELAQETARATEDISHRIEAIQADTAEAVQAIGRISQIIEDVNSYQTTIASAVEEQTATTGEMARNVSEAAAGSAGIASNIETVAGAAQATSAGISQAQVAATELAQLSGRLSEVVGQFRI
ncbi:MAG TPA: methyl-accepting chemotaxis protein [Kineosporiaceae bacterium]|nr:methyl-accepting chemotaxis protein [Kineosporiaceae bacterium]